MRGSRPKSGCPFGPARASYNRSRSRKGDTDENHEYSPGIHIHARRHNRNRGTAPLLVLTGIPGAQSRPPPGLDPYLLRKVSQRRVTLARQGKLPRISRGPSIVKAAVRYIYVYDCLRFSFCLTSTFVLTIEDYSVSYQSSV